MSFTVNNLLNSQGKSGSFSLSDSLTNYNLLRSGAYKKLAKAYYSNENISTDKETKSEKVEDNSLKLAANDAQSLEGALKDLKQAGNFIKKEITDKDGNKSLDYDREDLFKKAEAFVKSYNAVLDSGAKSDNTAVLRAVSSMTGRTKGNSKMLEDMGIKVGKDNKLTINEDTFKKADINKIKTMFSGYGSYGSQISEKAEKVENEVAKALKKTGTYTNKGGYNAFGTVGSLYEDMF